MKTWEIKIRFSVSKTWIDDGFDLFEWKDVIVEYFKSIIPYAYDWETKVAVNIKEIQKSPK